MAQNYIRVYVGVTARTDTDGRIRPLSIKWEDGTVFKIDRVSDVRFAATMRSGDHGDRWLSRRS